VLFNRKRNCSKRLSSIFDTGKLNKKSQDQYDKEERIVEEIAEHIDFT
jgi:hypothetical protein